jgi:hypothetical protein
MLPWEDICPRTSRSIASAETIVCPVLLIMSRYLDLYLYKMISILMPKRVGL